MPCTSSHFCFEAERTNPSKLPRGCSPCPPQLAAEKSGTVTFDQSGIARAPVLVAGEGIPPAVLVEVAAVAAELLLGQCGWPGDPVAVHAAAVSLRAATVLDANDLRGEPRPPERAEDAAVVTEVAIVIGGALPDADRGEMRRLERRDLPLVHRVVGNPVQPDLAVAP